MTLFIRSWSVQVLHVPLREPVRWAGHSEDHVAIVLLDLRASHGARGVSEMAVREKWHGETVASLVAALDKQLLPALKGMDLQGDAQFRATLTNSTQSVLARALADMACQDLLAQWAGLPLQANIARQMQDASASPDQLVDFSVTLTRDDPDAMASAATAARARHGVNAYKIKTGQGFDLDCAAVSAIRAAVGEDAQLSADSNSAGTPQSVAEMAAMLADYGVLWFEDPCQLIPNDEFVKIREASVLPILVDNSCRSLLSAKQFLSAGAAGLSIKTMKTGIDESIEIGAAAIRHGARATVGICASTSLSAIFSAALFSAIPASHRAMPCEESFFLNLVNDVLREPLQIRAGQITLPDAGPLADLIDWRAIEKLAINCIQSN